MATEEENSKIILTKGNREPFFEEKKEIVGNTLCRTCFAKLNSVFLDAPSFVKGYRMGRECRKR